jgi:phthalate 4,5-cis-dihydrodiol dehydrogenase
MSVKPLRLGIVGLGTAGRLMIPAVEDHPQAELAAVADTSPEVRNSLPGRLRICADLDAMLALPELNAVFIATPTTLHAEQTALAAAAGKHVLVEKPMAVSVAQAEGMIAAAQQAGVVLMVGHSHSYDAPIRKIREIVASGELGRARLIQNLTYTDWIYRPRRPDELDLAAGGGVIFRQGAHQFDVIRMIGGGLVKSVRASILDWDPQRSAAGAHAVFMQFEDGAVAIATYNGYGAFSSAELCFGVGEQGFPESPENVGKLRRAFEVRGPSNEIELKLQRSAQAARPTPPHQPFFGLTLVSCEKGDIRQSRDGLFLYDADGRCEIAVPLDRSPQHAVLAEFCDAVLGRHPPIHNGHWGLANVEICEAAVQSSRLGRDVQPVHQVAVQ